MPDQTELTSPFMPGPPPPSWPAAWIIHPSAAQNPAGVYHFRRAFELDRVPPRFPVRVSADNRFELFVNGARVCAGPARGDVWHWRYETVDIAPHLKPGRNVLAAAVWYMDGEHAPIAQMSHAPGFLVAGDPAAPATKAVNTPTGWKCLRNAAHTFLPPAPGEVAGYFAIGSSDRIDAESYPWGWEQPEFDDSGWDAPQRLDSASPRGARDAHSPWMLVLDLLPPMEATRMPVTAVVRSEGIVVENHRLAPDAPITVPANAKVALLFDNTVLTTGYPELDLERGRGASVRLRYAEALVGGPRHNQKGNRNEIEGKTLRGFHDAYVADGKRRVFRPLWWRTFRFLQVEVETASEPLTLHALTNAFSAYPFAEKGRFHSSDSSLEKIWEVGWRTARLCAHETYMDCPYYEQLQYGGDTRIQCLVSYYVSGDGRLARNAIAQLDDSRLPDGITQSRYPSHLTQVIPPFALWWVGMIHDYWMVQDDPEFVRTMLPGARTTLEWFLRHVGSDGLLGPLPWWNFVDWAHEFPGGVPVGANEGGSSILSLQVVLALREAAEMERALGLPDHAKRYLAEARRIAEGVRKRCWDDKSGLLADAPDKQRFSEHANILGILADAFSPDEAKAVAARLLEHDPAVGGTEGAPHLAPATFYFRFYLHRALRKAGLGDHYLDWLRPWRDMLAIGLTTWAENPEPTRSDCHAWSAHPNVDLLATVLGVESAAPGFARVYIAPHLGALEWAEGVVPHPKGEIAVKLRQEGSALHAEISLPAGVEGIFRHGGHERPLKPGRQSVSV